MVHIEITYLGNYTCENKLLFWRISHIEITYLGNGTCENNLIRRGHICK